MKMIAEKETAVTALQEEKKMIDCYQHEDLKRVPLHKQEPCRICGRVWYLSEGRLQFHRDQKQGDEKWKFPTSCPDCRPLSAIKAMESRKSNCPSHKVEFDSKAEAETYQRVNRLRFGGAEQYCYYCPQCHNYHLASKKPVEVTSSGALASPLAKVVQIVPAEKRVGPGEKPVEKPARKVGESRAEVARLLGLGHSTAEIASRLDMTPTNVLYHKKRIEGASIPKKTAVVDVEALDASDLDVTAERLRLQLEEIQRKKARLAEAKMLRVELVNGAIKIVKEGEHMLLPFEERDKLVLLLTQLSESGASTN